VIQDFPYPAYYYALRGLFDGWNCCCHFKTLL
jgi:hypothetical protein